MKIQLAHSSWTVLLGGSNAHAVMPVIPRPVRVKAGGILYAHGDHAWRTNKSSSHTISNRPYGPKHWIEEHGPKVGPIECRVNPVPGTSGVVQSFRAVLLSVELGRLHSTPHAELYSETARGLWRLSVSSGQPVWRKSWWPAASGDPWVWVFGLTPLLKV